MTQTQPTTSARTPAGEKRPLGPASARLEDELKKVVNGQGLIIWLDADGNYSTFVEGLVERSKAGEFPFPVFGYTGSYLELMLRLEKYGSGLHPEKVLVHMPGFNEQTIGETPLYELFKAGKRYRKALDTLIEEASVGLVRPEDGRAFREGKPTLEEADAWLSGVKSSDIDHFLIGLASRSPESLLSELFTDESNLVSDLVSDARASQFIEHLGKQVGLSSAWPQMADVVIRSSRPEVLVDRLRYLLSSWLMAVEFVSDLGEAPVLAGLQALTLLDNSYVTVCRRLVRQLRQQFAGEYRTLSAQFAEVLEGERTKHHAEALGSIDTFEFEEEAVRGAALTALHLRNWETAWNYAEQRHPEACFWVQHDKRRAHTWDLVLLAAKVGQKLGAAARGLVGCTSLEEATDRYRESLYRVDLAHRILEQRFHRLRRDEVENFDALREAMNTVRTEYRKWADAMTSEFAKLCEHYGPLPSPDLRQRAVYEQFVHPVIERGQRVAFFMVDAMRYEMAEELKALFEEKKFTASLKARLAELPTITAVGMNALAPVAQNGRLRLVLNDRDPGGFRSGDSFTVNDPATRVRAMETRSLGKGAIHLELSDITDASEAELKKLLKKENSSDLIVVRSLDLDYAGEKGFHLDTFEGTLAKIREAVLRLQHAGITHFVLSADHGFLLQDSTVSEIPYKNKPKRRHVLTPDRSGMSDVLEIPLSALDYDVSSESYLVFRRDTAVWDVKEKNPFVHGGNSLQERVIPVLVLEKAGKRGTSTANYEVVAKALPSEGGRERLELTVRLQKQSNGLLSFAEPRKISLSLRVLGRDGALLEALPQIIEVGPPGELASGAILVPPSADAATVVFSIEGETEEKVRVEVYHPDATEKIVPTIVEGWFNMRRNRRLGKPIEGMPPSSRKAISQSDTGSADQADAAARADWAGGIDDEEFRKVFELIESQESINEQELMRVLKTARRVRAFARHFDLLKTRVPFEVHIATLRGMKSYVKGDKR